MTQKIENEISNSEVIDKKRHIKVYLPDSFPQHFIFTRGDGIRITAHIMDDGDFMMDEIRIEKFPF